MHSKKQVVMVEGTCNGFTHYWLEVNGVVCDPHYKIIDGFIDVEENHDYVPMKKYNLNNVAVNRDYYEEKPSCNFLVAPRFWMRESSRYFLVYWQY